MKAGWPSGVLLALAGCSGPADAPRQPILRDAGPAATEGWRLVWSDEFDGPAGARPDPAKWTFDVGGDGWGNEQLEFDTDRPENAALDGAGNLVITAREEAWGGREYTSARLKTQGLFTHRYGRFEARVRLPRGAGIWPAFWLLGDDFETVGWPACGEIDVMEFRGQRPFESTAALHGPGYSAGESIHGTFDSDEDLSDAFHLFAVEWDAEGLVWSVDDTPFHRAYPTSVPAGSRWVFDHPVFIILNVAVGGTFVGSPDASTVFPQRMRVDHVRVYERAQ